MESLPTVVGRGRGLGVTPLFTRNTRVYGRKKTLPFLRLTFGTRFSGSGIDVAPRSPFLSVDAFDFRNGVCYGHVVTSSRLYHGATSTLGSLQRLIGALSRYLEIKISRSYFPCKFNFRRGSIAPGNAGLVVRSTVVCAIAVITESSVFALRSRYYFRGLPCPAAYAKETCLLVCFGRDKSVKTLFSFFVHA